MTRAGAVVQGTTDSVIRVLLVDDVPELRMLVRTILETDDEFTVVGEAANGDDAVRLAGLHAPDVVVLDLAMPVSDGVEALVRLRQEGPGRKVLLLSGLGPDEVAGE